MRRIPNYVIAIVLFILSTIILYLSFFNNSWHVANQSWLDNGQISGDHYVLGRMLKSHRDGILSQGGFLGIVLPPVITKIPAYYQAYTYQLDAYITNMKFDGFSYYASQIGGQGMFYSILDELLHRSPHDKLRLFYEGTSLLSAILLAFTILWFYQEFGLTVALTVLASTIFSQWLLDFGKSLFWSLWAFYLPMIAVAFFLRWKKIPVTRKQLLWFGSVVFVTIFIKCLFNGYEFNTTALVMMTVPIAYYCILEQVPWRKLVGVSGTAAASAVLAILVSFVILCFQFGLIGGGFSAGVNHIVYSFEKRSYANPQDFSSQLTASLEASPVDVVITYLNGVYVDLNNISPASNTSLSDNVYQIKYWYLLVIFALGSILLYIFRKRPFYKDKAGLVLVYATWFSILAPLSWYIIFKSHAYVHHFDTIVWQMPFTFFGFAVCGLVLRNVLLDFYQFTRRTFICG
ncbi:MAG: hypothetical protein P4L50_12285 [Anaerolineaceae bacterium]|nr:hypothetical protein [Anaerolineaceae bacterium]